MGARRDLEIPSGLPVASISSTNGLRPSNSPTKLRKETVGPQRKHILNLVGLSASYFRLLRSLATCPLISILMKEVVDPTHNPLTQGIQMFGFRVFCEWSSYIQQLIKPLRSSLSEGFLSC